MTGSGWTSHGKWYGPDPEPTVGRPDMLSKCGGPGMCRTCTAEAGLPPVGQVTKADDREEFQVAVTVFVTAPGCDEGDARSGAELAVRHALRSVALEHGVLETPHRNGPFRVRVHKVMDATTAGLNGYLAVRTTNRAYREGA